MTLPTPDDMAALGALFDAPDGPRPGAAPARKCRRHSKLAVHFCLDDPKLWHVEQPDSGSNCEPGVICLRCYRRLDAVRSRRGRNNRSRGTRDELAVARILGGRKVGELGLPWDVEVPGYLRVQCKKLDRMPSLNAVAAWLDAIPSGPELRAVTVTDAPGTGRVRRLVVMDLEEFAAFHGKAEPE